MADHDWSADVFAEIKKRKIETVCTVPDGGLTRLLNMVKDDDATRLVTLSTEEESMGVVTGSGSAANARWSRCNLPALAIASMRSAIPPSCARRA